MFLIRDSKNAKVGKVSVTYAPVAQTCPSSCPLKDNGCYAQGGNVGLHMRRLENHTEGLNGDTVALLEAAEIRDAGPSANGTPLRIHVSGDATTEFRAKQLGDAAGLWNGPVWSYTHAWRDVPRAAWGRVSVLASCESPTDARAALAKGYAPAVVTGPHAEATVNGRAYTKNGVKLIPCPAQTRDDVTCEKCRLCWNSETLVRQNAAIAFEAHGATKKRALTVVRA